MNVSKIIKYVVLASPNGYKAGKVLEALVENKFFTPKNCMVVTIQDEGALVTVSKVNNIEVLIIEKNKLEEALSEYSFDFLISCGWNHKISNNVIGMASVASINCHSSYLPDYKGASAHKHAWANAESHSGATIHILSPKFDGGNIVTQSKIKIFLWDTPGTLIHRIAESTAILLPFAILKLRNNDFGFSQEHLRGKYFFKAPNYKFF